MTAFQEKRQYVSRLQIPRAARYLQGLVNAVAEMGWSAPAKVQADSLVFQNAGQMPG